MVNEKSKIERSMKLHAKRLRDPDHELCLHCCVKMRRSSMDDRLTCPRCGRYKKIVECTSVSTNRQEDSNPNEAAIFTYKTIHHFKESYNHMQAKEASPTPDAKMLKIVARLFKKRIPMEEVTPACILQVLKELHETKLYDRHAEIWHRVVGREPRRLTKEQEEMLQWMFQVFFVVYPEFKKGRTNFISYSQLLSHFVRMLGLHYYSPFLKRIKGYKRRVEQETVIAGVFNRLNWPYEAVDSVGGTVATGIQSSRQGTVRLKNQRSRKAITGCAGGGAAGRLKLLGKRKTCGE